MIAVGALRYRVTLEEPSNVVVNGNATIVWTVRATVWASFEADTSREARLTGEATYRIGLRYRGDVTARWRVGLGASRKFTIVAPPQDPDGRRRELHVLATEILG